MPLTEKYGPYLRFSPFSKKTTLKPSSKPFDEALIARLESLLPLPSPPAAIPLSWLSRAADLLSLTLSDAAAIISDPYISGADRSALALHLDASVSLLDACNAASAEIDRILRCRLLLRLAVHLLSPSPTPESSRRARKLISEWRHGTPPPINPALVLHLGEAPRGKISVVRRAIYAVEAVSCLVAGSIAALLGGGGAEDLERIRVSGEFPWAAAFNKVLTAVAEGIKDGSAGEMAAVEAAVRILTAALEGEEEGKTSRVRGAMVEMEKAMEELTEGMERLAGAVAGIFRAALKTRNAALQSFRIGPQKCK